MMFQCSTVLLICVAPAAARMLHTNNKWAGADKIDSGMRPEVVSELLATVEAKWIQEGVNVLDGKTKEEVAYIAMEGSCVKVSSAVVQGSDGDQLRVRQYMKTVCDEPNAVANREMCVEYANAIQHFMVGDNVYNREQLDLKNFCQKFWTKSITDAAKAQKKKDDEAEQKREQEEKNRLAEEEKREKAEEEQRKQLMAAAKKALQEAEEKKKLAEAVAKNNTSLSVAAHWNDAAKKSEYTSDAKASTESTTSAVTTQSETETVKTETVKDATSQTAAQNATKMESSTTSVKNAEGDVVNATVTYVINEKKAETPNNATSQNVAQNTTQMVNATSSTAPAQKVAQVSINVAIPLAATQNTSVAQKNVTSQTGAQNATQNVTVQKTKSLLMHTVQNTNEAFTNASQQLTNRVVKQLRFVLNHTRHTKHTENTTNTTNSTA